MMSDEREDKEAYLNRAVEHIDITAFDGREMIDQMAAMSFSAREIARAAALYTQMLSDPDCTIILTLAGSSSAAGCMKVYSDLVKFNMVDVIVATGAAIADMDFFEALGYRHYQGHSRLDDERLNALHIDRIYDTLIDEDEVQVCDRTLAGIANGLESGPYSSREFIAEMGRWAKRNAKKKGSLVEEAFKNNVPIFSPAFTDSSAGFGLVLHQHRNSRKYITIDSIQDLRELTEIKIHAKATGLMMIGGGVPKNFAQDCVVCAQFMGKKTEPHKYAVQITVADVRDGGCSGSTLREAASWGKVGTAHEQMVYGEASAVFPLIASDAYHRGVWKTRVKRNCSRILEHVQ